MEQPIWLRSLKKPELKYLKYELTREGEKLRLKLGMTHHITFPKETELSEVILLVTMLAETVSGIPIMEMINNVLKEQSK